MSRAMRVLVTGAAGQVGVDLVDVLGGAVPPGGDRSFQPDGRPVPEGEFEVLGLTRHELDVADSEAVRRAVQAARTFDDERVGECGSHGHSGLC